MLPLLRSCETTLAAYLERPLIPRSLPWRLARRVGQAQQCACPTRLAWSTGLGAVTPQALAEREQVPIVTASERLDEAVRSGFMDRHSLLVNYPALYTVTAEGRRLARKHAGAGSHVSPKGSGVSRVGIKDMRHMIACAGVTAALERRYPDHRVIGERELRRDEHDAGRRLASVEIAGAGRRRSHLPDIVVWPPGTPEGPAPLPVAVEVELTKKTREELLENLRAWAWCRTIEAVVYFAETRKIEEKLLDLDRGVESRGCDRGQPPQEDSQTPTGVAPHRRLACLPRTFAGGFARRAFSPQRAGLAPSHCASGPLFSCRGDEREATATAAEAPAAQGECRALGLGWI